MLFGDLLFPLVSLGVAIILFEGALTLNFKEISGHGRMVTHLVSFGMLVTWGVIATAAHFLIDFSWQLACLFAALVVVTGPTVIVPMLRSIQPKNELGNILRWEGIIIDPIGALFAVLVYEFIVSTADPTTHVLHALGYTLGIGLGAGALFGHTVGVMIRNNWVPPYLKNVMVLTLSLAAFVFSNEIQEESGLLTVTVMGIWLANMKNVDIEDIIEFKETLTVLLISALFILLAGRLNSDALLSLGWSGIALLAAVMLVARPLSVWISAIGTNLTSPDKWFLSWMAPRGIVAAAVSSLFAIKLQEKQLFEGAELLVPLVFLVIIGTVVIQSLTASWWAGKLGVKQGSPQGLLIFGSFPFTRQLAKLLQERDIRTVLADTNWESIRLARMDNIPVYFGNPASSHAETHLDLGGIGRVLLVSPYRQTNPLVKVFYQDELGEDAVFELTSGEQKHARYKMVHGNNAALFDESMSYAKLASMSAQGAQVKVTRITENFSFEQFAEYYPKAVPLCVWDQKTLTLVTANDDVSKLVEEGCEVFSLIPSNGDAELAVMPK